MDFEPVPRNLTKLVAETLNEILHKTLAVITKLKILKKLLNKFKIFKKKSLAPINQPIEYGTKCFELCRELKIGKWNYSSEPYFEFTHEEFNILKNKNLVFDGTNGGLVL